MQPRIVPIHKYSRLKIALAVSAAVIAGLVFLLFVNNNQNTKPVEYSRNEPVEKTITSDDKSGGISAPAVAENGYKEEKYYLSIEKYCSLEDGQIYFFIAYKSNSGNELSINEHLFRDALCTMLKLLLNLEII